jgi:glycerophosphoryl diester phosphodiesterase family protein
MAADGLITKLLSHRLRGFDDFDSTRSGLERGLAAGARHVEFDVRFTADDHLIAYHDPFFRADDGAWHYVGEWKLADLRTQQTMSRLATLEEMCAAFADHGSADARIHLDMKVTGREEAVHAILAKFGLLPHAVLVSWLPSVLVRFNAISPQTPLCFSHITTFRAPWLYPIMKGFIPASRYLSAPLLQRLVGHRVSAIAPRGALAMMSTCYHFHDDGDPAAESNGDERPGCVDGHVVPGLLTGLMLELLRRTQGFVCVPISLATAQLGRERAVGAPAADSMAA